MTRHRIVRRSGNAAGSEGASAVEYAIIVSLIAIAIFASVVLFGGVVQGLFDRGATCTSAPDTCK